MARSKTRKSAQSEVNGTEEREINSSFLGIRAPRKPVEPKEGSRGCIAFSDRAVGPGTVGGMRTYGIVNP